MSFRVTTKREQIRSVRDRFAAAYGRGREGWTGPVWSALDQLDLETCSASDVTTALGGRTGWCALICSCCGTDSDATVRMAKDGDLLASNVCRSCTDAAAKAIRSVK